MDCPACEEGDLEDNGTHIGSDYVQVYLKCAFCGAVYFGDMFQDDMKKSDE